MTFAEFKALPVGTLMYWRDSRGVRQDTMYIREDEDGRIGYYSLGSKTFFERTHDSEVRGFET